jgi:hypothetical protein
MTMWGVGLFDSDVAQDVRAAFTKEMDAGASVYVAAERVQESFAQADYCTVTLALAALQAEHDLIHPKIKKKALTLIISGEAEDAWREGPPAIYETRKSVLYALRVKLLAIPT